jgi:hypothetical protein
MYNKEYKTTKFIYIMNQQKIYNDITIITNCLIIVNNGNDGDNDGDYDHDNDDDGGDDVCSNRL